MSYRHSGDTERSSSGKRWGEVVGLDNLGVAASIGSQSAGAKIIFGSRKATSALLRFNRAGHVKHIEDNGLLGIKKSFQPRHDIGVPVSHS